MVASSGIAGLAPAKGGLGEAGGVDVSSGPGGFLPNLPGGLGGPGGPGGPGGAEADGEGGVILNVGGASSECPNEACLASSSFFMHS